ncbi:hypothetical protein [Mucilaginibacter sp. 3215]|uniref:hypothetical protein n=1 Tax=Mucilaginibacter sp. 3215 TaxID=3373912 RepID=UPI003D1A123B
MNQKIFFVKTSLYLAASVLLMTCGTIGGIGKEVDFPVSKQNLEKAIDSLYAKHPEYKIPGKWKAFDGWSKAGYDFLESKIFYFKSPPEEMYYVTFIGDSAMLANPRKVGIGLRAIYNGDAHGKWLLESELNSEEKERINTRFANEIITKLELYTKTKASK